MIIVALLFGFIYSLPIGSLGQIMLNRAVERGFWHGFSIAIISSLVDFLFCEIFLLGAVQLGNINPFIKIFIQIIGLIFFLYIGLKEIIFPFFRRKRDFEDRISEDFKLDGKTIFKNVFLVISYYLTNPTYIVFWVTFSTTINHNFIPYQTFFYYTLFSFLFFVGALLCQYFSIVVMIKSKAKIGKFMKYITVNLYSVSIIYFLYIVVKDVYVTIIQNYNFLIRI
ncbi:LysE family transporter [Deferribacter abyssi]|uniref:LysE family transporter n=1 Tax=Deferribacter abyssi TaxID=213806 RepID=UPI003C2A3FAD